MADQRQSFLDLIANNPIDYINRLIYADWLDEQGEHEEADYQRGFENHDKWLRDFAKMFGSSARSNERSEITYDLLIKAGHIGLDGNDWLMENTETYKNIDYDKWEEFWVNFCYVTRTERPDDAKEWNNCPFTCSC